jgi:methionyl aminopeptidase
MITIKNRASIAKMEEAGAILSNLFTELEPLIKVGVTTAALDQWIEEQIKQRGLVSRMKGYMGYQHVSCISVNDEVVHGVPSDRILHKGDMLTVDVCVSFKGYCADMARIFFVGAVSEYVKKFAQVAEQSLFAGIAAAVPGNRLGDISAAIQATVENAGFGIVRDFAGHGIGKQMHEDPEVLNYGLPGQGPILREGMAFAIEPMITMGKDAVYITEDGWTVRTEDSSLAAHVEDTIVITSNGPKNITRNRSNR